MDLFGSKKNTADKKENKKTAPAKAPKKKEAVSMQDLYNEAAPTAKAAKGKKAVAANHPAYRILIRPLITEKATNLAAENKYAFMIAATANKIEVTKAVKAVYGVNPLKVNIINTLGKKVRRGKVSGVRSARRKAIVTLPKGETIKIYEGV